MPYSHIFLYLQKEGLLTLRELKPATFPYPPGYDANAHCEFNMGAPGHTLENCFAFQNRVQDLIETKVITFTPRRPNVNTNAMPTHEGASVSAIEEVNKGDLIKKVEEIQTPIVVIGAQLLKSGLIPIDLVDEENVEELKSFIQQMLDQGEMQIERHNEDMKEKEIVMIDIPYDAINIEIPITPSVIEFPAPFAYEDEKAVPWIYQPRAFKKGQEDQPVVINEPNVTSIVGPAGMTRSG